MSTNAVIKIKSANSNISSLAVWKHWDGYPEATLPWLEKFNKEFCAGRGDDPEYKFAQLLRSSAHYEKEFNLDPSKFTGWGVVPSSTSADFTYTLHTDGSVTVEGNF